MRVVLTIALLVLAAAAAGCGRQRTGTLAARLACPAIEGVEVLLERPKGDVILIDGDRSAEKAAEAVGCAAASQGERVVWGVGVDAPHRGEDKRRAASAARTPGQIMLWGATLERFRRAGADVAFVALDAPHAPAAPNVPPEQASRAAGEARSGRLEGALGDVRARLSPERMILLLSAPDGARAPVGLSGHTWRPLGARLPPQTSISLRAEASTQPGVRVRLLPFEDVPPEGAALRYDGIIEVGPPTIAVDGATHALREDEARTS